MRQQVPHPHKSGKVYGHDTSVFVFLDSYQDDKNFVLRNNKNSQNFIHSYSFMRDNLEFYTKFPLRNIINSVTLTGVAIYLKDKYLLYHCRL